MVTGQAGVLIARWSPARCHLTLTGSLVSDARRRISARRPPTPLTDRATTRHADNSITSGQTLTRTPERRSSNPLGVVGSPAVLFTARQRRRHCAAVTSMTISTPCLVLHRQRACVLVPTADAQPSPPPNSILCPSASRHRRYVIGNLLLLSLPQSPPDHRIKWRRSRRAFLPTAPALDAILSYQTFERN